MQRYFVELKRHLKNSAVISFHVRAYNRSQIVDLFGTDYFIVTVEEE